MQFLIIQFLCILAVVLPYSAIKSLDSIDSIILFLNIEGTILLIYAISPQKQNSRNGILNRIVWWFEQFQQSMAQPVIFHLPILYLGFIFMLIANTLPIIIKYWK